MSRYQLVITVPIEAVDDPAAREEAWYWLDMLAPWKRASQFNAKLQRLYDNKPPRGVSVDAKGTAQVSP